MLNAAVLITAGMIGVAMALTLRRLIIGPSAPDRVLALDTIGINAIALVMLLGVGYGLSDYFEASLLIAMMGFVGTVALCKFLLSGDVIE